MKKKDITQPAEPSDVELQAIMEQVLAEAKHRFEGIHYKLKMTILSEIQMAKARFESKYP